MKMKIANRKTRLESKVRILGVTLTNRCNLHCKMCLIEKPGNAVMSRKVKEEVVKGILRFRKDIMGRGEVFLDGDFNNMMKEAIKYGIKQSVITNALLLNEEMIKEFVNNI